MPPRYLTPADPAAPNVAGRAVRLARMLGLELFPWQIEALIVAGELDPLTGRYRREEMLLIVPRRAGKSLAAFVTLLRVMLSGRRRRGWYTAHRREVGAALWRDEWFPLVEASPLGPVVDTRRSNGSEAFTTRQLGSTVRLFAPDGSALRSQNADVVVVDEAREFTLEQGGVLEAAVAPAQALPRRRQRWIVSNAGSFHSTWLAGKRSAALAALEVGDPMRTGLVEWSAPADADDADPRVWAAAHPAVGHGLELDALEADRELIGADRFRIEYLGMWPQLDTSTPFAVAWAQRCARDHASPADPLWLAVELDTDRLKACIIAAGWSLEQPDVPALEVVEYRDHGPWLLPRLAELVAQHEPAGVVYDRGGPIGSEAAALADLECEVIGARTELVAASAGSFHDRVLAGAVIHAGGQELTTAVFASERKAAGGAWVYRRTSAAVVDVGPLIGGALACYQLTAPGRAPEVR